LRIARITRCLHTSDVLVIGFATILSLLNCVFAARVTVWRQLAGINTAVSAVIVLLAWTRHRTGNPLLRLLHDWYIPPVVFLSFKELYFMVKPIHFGRDYDALLIAIDRWLLGVNPTEWMMRIAAPVLTELLQLAYTLFYVLFLMLGYELYRRGDVDLFRYFMFTCVYGFFLSYLGYFFLPAVGPRFTLHDFSALDRELPGLLLTPWLRWFVNAGGSVPMGVPNEVAIAGTQRDVFPSGHTMMTLVLMYLSARYHVRMRWFIYVTGMLLIAATVYQRYHYVVDVVAGAAFMVACVSTSPYLYAWTKRRLQTMETRLQEE
jgi:membrane-associated phospholipid phosphatase